MKWFKLIFALIIIGLIGLFIGQNISTWTQLIEFKFEIPFLVKSQPKLEFYLLLIVSAAMGFFVGLAMMVKPYLKVRRNLARERKENKEPAPAMRQAQAS